MIPKGPRCGNLHAGVADDDAVMAGMIPVMVSLMSRDMTAMEATSLRFWGDVPRHHGGRGGRLYPVNVWLVAVKLKHGNGHTVRGVSAAATDGDREADDPAVALNLPL